MTGDDDLAADLKRAAIEWHDAEQLHSSAERAQAWTHLFVAIDNYAIAVRAAALGLRRP